MFVSFGRDKFMEKKSTRGKALEEQENLQNVAMKILSGEFDIQEYLGLDDNALEVIYSLGREMFNLKKYEKAKDVFNLLCLLKANNPKYIAACGSACFMLKDYINAMLFFRMAVVNGDYTPKSIMKIAECTVRLHQIEPTLLCLKEIETLMKNNKEFQSDSESLKCYEKAKMIKENLENQLKELNSETKTPESK